MCATNIVMKMQVGEKMKARNSCPFLAVWLRCFALLAGCALKPVSYTHLDVYKRQVVRLMTVVNFKNFPECETQIRENG